MIGGNTTAMLQTRKTSKNAIGESVDSWTTVKEIKGFLDLSSGDSKYTTYDAKIQESTHAFVCDYVDIANTTAENSRMVVGGQVYDITLIDDPMGLHRHLEFYLLFRGGQNVID